MHEVGLVEQTIRAAISTADAAHARTIERLTFALEPGGHVTPEAVRTLFRELSAGTPAAGAKLEFEELIAQYGCWSCEHTFTSRTEPATCPKCDSPSISSLHTTDLVLKYVDIREDIEVDDVHAGHGRRAQPLHDELARAHRRRQGFIRR